jgi:hypothetical protein
VAPGASKPVCLIWKPISYAYDPAQLSGNDTRETALEIRKNNAAQKAYCK